MTKHATLINLHLEEIGYLKRLEDVDEWHNFHLSNRNMQQGYTNIGGYILGKCKVFITNIKDQYESIHHGYQNHNSNQTSTGNKVFNRNQNKVY